MKFRLSYIFVCRLAVKHESFQFLSREVRKSGSMLSVSEEFCQDCLVD